jgi:hypothetical protein
MILCLRKLSGYAGHGAPWYYNPNVAYKFGTHKTKLFNGITSAHGSGCFVKTVLLIVEAQN